MKKAKKELPKIEEDIEDIEEEQEDFYEEIKELSDTSMYRRRNEVITRCKAYMKTVAASGANNTIIYKNNWYVYDAAGQNGMALSEPEIDAFIKYLGDSKFKINKLKAYYKISW